jgi:cation diffusion facilitator family transporter
VKEQEDVRSLEIALGAYVLVFAMKLTVYLMSGVMALMAEALHTLSDIFVTSFLLVAAIWSRKEADKVHMFGHGRAQNAAAQVAATLFISFTSLRLYEEAIPRLFKPAEVTYENLGLALGVIVVSMAIAAIPLIKLYTQKQRGAAAKAQFMESINDELGLLAALIGTLFILWGQPIADPIASIVVATIIAYNGIKLFLENLSFLLGRSPGPEYLAQVEGVARSVPGVLGVHDLRAEYIGPDTVHAGMHIEVQRGLPIEEADRIAEEVRQRVHQGTESDYCVIHVDPAEPEGDCGTRQFERWNVQRWDVQRARPTVGSRPWQQ